MSKGRSNTPEIFDCVVLGGGASGMMAALWAAKQGANVAIVEHLDKLGKKILATGNGKCNFTNKNFDLSFYRGLEPEFATDAFDAFSNEDAISFFKELGIYPKEKNGYYYPNSEQATSVVQQFLLALKKHKVTSFFNEECAVIKKNDTGLFVLRTNNQDILGKTLVVATGLLAGRNAGCDGSSFPHIEKFGHHFQDVVPALVQLKCKDSFLKNLAGIRAEIDLKLLQNGSEIFKDHGELLHIQGGLSGIVCFQASRFVSYGVKNGSDMVVEIDYAPGFSKESLQEELVLRFYQYGEGKNAYEALIGLFPDKLCMALLEKTKIPHDRNAMAISMEQLSALVNLCKSCKLQLIGTKDFADAQVCAGGVKTCEVDSKTMESKLVSNLFFCGEVLDIDGMCGGYNLQWAWSSGYVAGIHAGKRSLND